MLLLSVTFWFALCPGSEANLHNPTIFKKERPDLCAFIASCFLAILNYYAFVREYKERREKKALLCWMHFSL